MVPPGEAMYFFSIEEDNFVAFDHATRRVRKFKDEVATRFDEKSQLATISTLIEGDSRFAVLFEDLDLETVNVVRGIPPTDFRFNQEDIEKMNCKPRVIKSLEEPEDNKPWAISKSCFRDYKADSKELLDQCFENDWEYIRHKVEYIIKDNDERAEVRRLLKENYAPILHAYKYQAGVDLQSNFTSISKEGFVTLITSMGDFVDN